MGRPPLGSAKRDRTITLHVTEAQHRAITKRGGAEWARTTLIHQLTTRTASGTRSKATAATTPPLPPLPDPEPIEPTPTNHDHTPGDGHLHRREKTGETWMGGTPTGIYKCGLCGVLLN